MYNRSRKVAFNALAVVCLVLPGITNAQVATIGDAERIKAIAGAYHTAGNTKVSVELKDGRSYIGRITSIEEDHFILLDTNSNREARIRYDNVARLRKKGMSKAAKTAIWIGVGAGIGALIIFGRPGRTIGPICPLGCGL